MKEDEEQTLDDILKDIDLDKIVEEERINQMEKSLFWGKIKNNSDTCTISFRLVSHREKSIHVFKKKKGKWHSFFIPNSLVLFQSEHKKNLGLMGEEDRIVLTLPRWYCKELGFYN